MYVLQLFWPQPEHSSFALHTAFPHNLLARNDFVHKKIEFAIIVIKFEIIQLAFCVKSIEKFHDELKKNWTKISVYLDLVVYMDSSNACMAHQVFCGDNLVCKCMLAVPGHTIVDILFLFHLDYRSQRYCICLVHMSYTLHVDHISWLHTFLQIEWNIILIMKLVSKNWIFNIKFVRSTH